MVVVEVFTKEISHCTGRYCRYVSMSAFKIVHYTILGRVYMQTK